MNERTLTIKQLLEHPKVCDLVSPEDIERIAASLTGPEQTSKDPMYIRILYGVGAWFAAIFLILFLGFNIILFNVMGAIIWGIVFLAAAIFIARASKVVFLSQLSLALAFAGNIAILFGMAGEYKSSDVLIVLVTHAFICIVVYPLFPNSIYRFLAPIALVALATAWVIEDKVFFLMHFLIAAEMILAGVLLLRRKLPSLLTPLTYSAAAMLPATLLFVNLTQIHIWSDKFNTPLWPSSIALAVGLIYLYFHLAGGTERLHEPWMICAIVSIVFLGIFSTPGVLVAIGLLVLGYTFGDLILMALSYLFLPCFLVCFYYALNIDLAYKSWVIAGSGILLLVVRYILGRLQPTEVTA